MRYSAKDVKSKKLPMGGKRGTQTVGALGLEREAASDGSGPGLQGSWLNSAGWGVHKRTGLGSLEQLG